MGIKGIKSQKAAKHGGRIVKIFEHLNAVCLISDMFLVVCFVYVRFLFPTNAQ
jgi:hypothetical protein